MKRVSFEIAKALKEAGYPQELRQGTVLYPTVGEFKGVLSSFNSAAPGRDKYSIVAPEYLEVWLWLCREKHIPISCSWFAPGLEWFSHIKDETKRFSAKWPNADPEDVIIAAIEHLVTNDLIK